MTDLAVVKRKKRNKIIAIVCSIASIIIIAFIIISFLGKYVGTFTITMREANVKLTMSTHSDFRDASSYIKVDDMKKIDSYCYQEFKYIDGTGTIDFEKNGIDSEETTYLDFANKDSKGNIAAVPFFKLTFFIKNIGDTEARFDLSVNILQNTPDPSNKRTLDGLLRVILVEDGAFDKVYGKRSDNHTHHTREHPEQLNDLEYICGDPDSEYYEGQCEPFISESRILSHSKTNFLSNDVVRYTVIYWLEGHDYPEGYFEQPKDAKLKLGVEINAYAN